MLLEITIINSDGSLPFKKKTNPKTKPYFKDWRMTESRQQVESTQTG